MLARSGQGRFGWARRVGSDEDARGGEDIERLAALVAADLNAHRRVCLGFECPLYIPVREDPLELTRARSGEGSRPWSAGAGLGSMAVGLAESIWLLKHVRAELEAVTQSYLDWEQFAAAGRGLFLWEAFITGAGKAKLTERTNQHVADALVAVDAFLRALPDPREANTLEPEPAFSLIGAALLRTGWSTDPTLVSQPCLVISG